MMDTKKRLRALLIGLAALVLMTRPLTAEVDNGTARLVERARAGYASAGAFHETLDIAVTMPDGNP